MNKEKFMQLAEKAFDEGAYIRIHFTQFKENFVPVTKQEAHDTVLLAQEALGGYALAFNKGGNDDPCHSYDVRNDNISVTASFKKEVDSNVG